MNTSQKIGKNLKEARKFCGYTQSQVAAMLNMKQQQYSRFETGMFELNYEQILFFCKLYKITPNELFDIN